MSTPESFDISPDPHVSLSDFYGAPSAPQSSELNVGGVDGHVAWAVRSAFQENGIVQDGAYADVRPAEQTQEGPAVSPDAASAAFAWQPELPGPQQSQ